MNASGKQGTVPARHPGSWAGRTGPLWRGLALLACLMAGCAGPPLPPPPTAPVAPTVPPLVTAVSFTPTVPALTPSPTVPPPSPSPVPPTAMAGPSPSAVSTQPASSSPTSTLDALRRALHPPTVRPGQACPTSPVHPAINLAPEFTRAFFAVPFRGEPTALGGGPIYMVFGQTDPGAAVLRYPPAHQVDVSSPSVTWPIMYGRFLESPSYRGRFLARTGRQIDGPNRLFWAPERDPYMTEVTAVPGPGLYTPSGWVVWPTTIVMNAPGCYFVQFDGDTFSEVVVFSAAPQ